MEMITRRRALGMGWAAAGLLAIGGTERSKGPFDQEISALLVAARKHLPGASQRIPRPLPQREQLAVASNARFNALGRPASRAFVVVHPGFALTQTQDMVTEHADASILKPERDPKYWKDYMGYAERLEHERGDITDFTEFVAKREGAYKPYFYRLTALMSSLRTATEPVIVYNEARDVYKDTQRAETAPPQNAFIVVTRKGDPEPVPEVTYNNNGRPMVEAQNIDRLYDWLGKVGVTEVHLAGEYGLSRGGGVWPACAGTVAGELIDRGFSVHGIEGAIFPTQPMELYGGTSHKPSMDIARAMHFDTVPMPAM